MATSGHSAARPQATAPAAVVSVATSGRQTPKVADVPITTTSLFPAALSAAAWLAGFWILGVVCVGAYSVRQLAKSLRQIRSASPCTDQELLEQAAELRQALGLRVEPRLMITNDPTSVLTFGARRPIVLISAKTLADCTAEERRMVLAHEFAHIRRRDPWLGLIPQFAQTLFFFHPMVWLACREFDFAREAACDEEAIACLQIGSGPYGRLLLKLGSRRQAATTLCTPGVSSHFHLLRRRIAMLDKPTEATPRKTPRRTLALTCLIGALCIAPLTLIQGQSARTISLKTSSTTAASAAGKKSSKVVAKHAKATTKHAPAVVATKAAGSSKLSLRVFHLKNANAENAVAILHQVLPPESGGKVVADAKSNSIIVNADEATADQISTVVKNLDEIPRVQEAASLIPKDPQQVSVYPLKYAEVGTVLEILHTLYGKPNVAVVKAAADFHTSSIVVTAPENRTREVSELITKLDVPPTSVPQGRRVITRLIKVRYGDPKQIIPVVKAMMKTDAPQYIGQDLTSNDILVITTEDNCNRVQYLVNILDIQKPS